jgi:hypothetical protein|tara:strand:+ start:615 stop:1280 length:666 start_codon:yes stop_codon:yes gene_type:complete
MALNKLKFNSLNVTPTAGKTIGFNSSANGLEATLSGGSMTFIKKLTASSSSTLSFVDGSSDVVLDNTYKEYIFVFNNIHPATDGSYLTFNYSVDSGSNYNVTKTSTAFRPFHYENDSTPELAYNTTSDLAQSTDFQRLCDNQGNANDEAMSGTLTLFNPSSTTFVKHWISNVNMSHDADYPASVNWFTAGYGNTTSAVDAIQFKMNTGNIDAGTITLYGIN